MPQERGHNQKTSLMNLGIPAYAFHEVADGSKRRLTYQKRLTFPFRSPS